MMRSVSRRASSDRSTEVRARRVKGVAAGFGVVLGASVSVAACGSIDADDLFSGDTTSASSSSSGGGSGGSSSSSTTSSSSSGVPPTCGNGALDPSEACDGADVGGATCTSLGFANPGAVTCTSTCELDTSACKAVCDGAKIEPGEDCDGALLDGHDCLEFGFTKAAGLTCKGCQLDPSTCQPTCGDGEIEPGEKCDGSSLGGATCADFGFTNPTGLTCRPDCSGVDESGCKPTCGNNLLEKGEPCEGTNLDGKTCTDLGYVAPAGLKCTGCTLDGSGCKAVCGNGKIEPGEDCDDGNTSNGDGCSSACKQDITPGSTCGSAIALNVSPGSVTITGSTVGGGTHTGSSCEGGVGRDRVYALTVQANGYLTVSLSRAQTAYDSVLYISQGCSDLTENAAILCADSYDMQGGTALDGGEVVSIRVQQGQKYFVFVDGYASTDVGAYEMVVDLSTGTGCNDPVPIPLEPGAPMTVLGSNNNGNTTMQGTCGGQPGGHTVYRITRPNAGSIDVDTNASTNYNSVLYARSICQTQIPELACSNQNGTAAESITVNNVQANTPIYVFVDGSQAGGGSQNGNYGLTLTP